MKYPGSFYNYDGDLDFIVAPRLSVLQEMIGAGEIDKAVKFSAELEADFYWSKIARCLQNEFVELNEMIAKHDPA